jgi:hypothetical protein
MKRGLIRHREALRWEEWARRQTGDDVASASRRCQHAHARDQTNVNLPSSYASPTPACYCTSVSTTIPPTQIRPFDPRSPRGDYAATLASVRALISRPLSHVKHIHSSSSFHPPPSPLFTWSFHPDNIIGFQQLHQRYIHSPHHPGGISGTKRGSARTDIDTV